MATTQRLSLDVVIGVVCGAAFAVSATGATLPLVWWVLLPLCTWTVYAVDHLLDAREAERPRAANPRHRFFQRHFRRLAAVTACMLVALPLVAALFLPPRILLVGSILAAASALHLAWARRRFEARAPKELSAAAVYTAGIWFGPVMTLETFEPWVGVLIGLHFVAAATNLAVFSLFEIGVDRTDGQTSLARSWGPRPIRSGVRILTAAAGLLVLAALAAGPSRLAPHFLVLGLLVTTPALLDAARRRVAGRTRYRTIGDLAFLLMALPAWLLP